MLLRCSVVLHVLHIIQFHTRVREVCFTVACVSITAYLLMSQYFSFILWKIYYLSSYDVYVTFIE